MKINKEILSKMAVDQNKLQKLIIRESGSRERTIKDIELSLIEEILEWNKERGGEFSHKTWKPKEFNKEKHDEEFVDILFFALEMFNYCGIIELKYFWLEVIKEKELHVKYNRFHKDDYEKDLITIALEDSLEYIISSLLVIAEQENINIIETFYKKLKINYSRFGYDYDLETGVATKDRITGYKENNSVICPYCDEVYDNSDDDSYSGGEELEVTCGSCGKDFTYSANVDITFDSNKVDRCQDCKYFSEDTQYCEKEDDYLNFDEYACGYFKEKIKG